MGWIKSHPFSFEKERDFGYIEGMKQRMILKPDQVQQTSFNKEMKKSLEVLQLNNSDLKTFLKEVSMRNPFIRYSSQDDTDADFTMFATQSSSLLEVVQEQNRWEKESIPEDMVEYLTSMLDSNGYFRADLNHLVVHSLYSKKELQRAIFRLQRFEPVGCYCFSVKESLRVQCEMSQKAASETGEILCEYLKELSCKDYEKICDATNLTMEEVKEGLAFIQTLHPKPACNYATDAVVLQPEAKIYVEKQSVRIEMLQQDFELDILEHTSRELKAYRQEAKSILLQVQKRNLTILQILQVLCSYQKDFFLSGSSLHHCTLKQVAQQCGLHLSTVSRAIQGKSFEFENRYYPIKFLLSHDGVSDRNASEIEEKIKDLIHQEDRYHPYSDAKLQSFLKQQGIFVARRTIAKYREHCGIVSSNQRKIKE